MIAKIMEVVNLIRSSFSCNLIKMGVLYVANLQIHGHLVLRSEAFESTTIQKRDHAGVGSIHVDKIYSGHTGFDMIDKMGDQFRTNSHSAVRSLYNNAQYPPQ